LAFKRINIGKKYFCKLCCKLLRIYLLGKRKAIWILEEDFWRIRDFSSSDIWQIIVN